MIDAHCHIIPDVDDGSPSIRSSIKMINAAKEAGITHIVTTSHNRDRYSLYDEQTENYNLLLDRAKDIDINIVRGSEVYWKIANNLDHDKLKKCCLGSSDLFLLEFSYGKFEDNWKNIIFEIQQAGLQVIIAHPERYRDVQHDIDIAQQMKNMGCLLMCSANFMDKRFMYGHGAVHKKTTKKLLKEGIVDIICSDAHAPEGYEWLPKAIKFASKYNYDNDKAQEILRQAFK